MKRKNLLFAVMTALFLLVSPSLWAEESGTCGDFLTWTLDDQGVLTIEGEGAMEDFGNVPWAELSFTTVVIKDGVTTIGTNAFINCYELASVDIPSSVTSIGESAFCNCSGLTSVTIPNSVTNMGESAFSNCTGLTSVTLPNSLASISTMLFNNCTSLTSVEIPNSVTSIGNVAFGYCTALTSVTLSNSLKSIEKNAFVKCPALTSVTFPESLTSIGEYAFRWCTGLTKIESLAETPPTCGSNVFPDVDKDKCVLYVPKNSIEAYKAAETWKEFNNTKAAVTVVASGDCGENLTWTLDGDGVLTIDGEGAMTDYTFDSPSPWASLSFTTAVIGEGVTTIGEYAFYECGGLKSVTIPNSVTEMKEYAFYRTGLTSVTLPESLTSIAKCMFTECTELKSVTIPASVTSIGEMAFCACSELEKIESLATTPPTCPDNVFDGIDKSTCVLYVPENSIEAYKAADAWKEFTNIKAAVTVVASGDCGENVKWTLDSEGLLTITGEGAMTDYDEEFPQWRNLSPTKVVIGEGVTTIGIFAFSGCKGLTSVEIPTSVTSIGDGAFTQCTGLTKIESLAEIPPTCGGEVFIGVDKDKCELSVPWTSAEAYKAADQWKDFTNIVTGINGVAQENNAVVSASNGVITVTGTAYNAVTEVYGTNGALVYRGTGKTIAVPSAGIYVVRAAGKTVKVNTAK